ncbi:MAG TPA: inorganic phosphate transporter [Anaerolineales bacterium]
MLGGFEDWLTVRLMFAILLVLALIFDFLNGLHDSSNIVATVIASRALHPRVALILAALAELAGPFLFGVAVATTVGDELLHTTILTTNVVIAALFAAVVWNLVTWYFGIPSSSSHALLGGLLGAGLVTAGLEVVKIQGLLKILLALLASPLVGLVVGFLIMRLTVWLVRNSTPGVNNSFRRLQILTLVGLGLSHGANDAQKTMGVITLGLVTAGIQEQFLVPIWVIAVSALAIALGTSLGGWRLIRTLGARMYRVRPIHGLTSQIAGASVILGAALLGGPVSTTQVMSSAIIGVGAGERASKVRWNILGEMLTAWLLTIPVTAGLAALAYLAVELLSR